MLLRLQLGTPLLNEVETQRGLETFTLSPTYILGYHRVAVTAGACTVVRVHADDCSVIDEWVVKLVALDSALYQHERATVLRDVLCMDPTCHADLQACLSIGTFQRSSRFF